MICKPRHGLFITGTSTEVGKTYITSLLARRFTAQGCRVGVYKPAASGGREMPTEEEVTSVPPGSPPRLFADDAWQLWDAAGRPGELHHVCPQVFRAPLAPHLAAQAEGRLLDTDLLRSGISWWHDRCDLILVEGAGGLMSPLGDQLYVATLAAEFGYPLLIVAPNALGVINQTLQTVITARAWNPPLPIAGVILNDLAAPPAVAADVSRGLNRAELERHLSVPLLAHVPYEGTLESLSPLDWRTFAPTT